MNDDELKNAHIVFRYALENEELFDWKESKNCDKETLRSYGVKI